MIIKKLAIISVIMVMGYGCGSVENIESSKEALSSNDLGVCMYPYASTATENFFRDNLDRPYNMTISTDLSKNYQIRASHVAELASMMVNLHDQMGMENNSQVYNLLSSGYIIVLEDNDTYYDWFEGSPEALQGMDPAMVVITPEIPCWDIPEGANWSMLIHAEFFNAANLSVITHRMAHVVSVAMTGDRDDMHENSELWMKKPGESGINLKSLQARTFLMYEAFYGRCNRDIADPEVVPPYVTPQKNPAYTEGELP